MKEFIASGAKLIKEKADGLTVFFSSIHLGSVNDETLYDEKHYFVVPLRTSEYGFSLHTTRCLPPSVPDINQLPKRRIFHFAHQHAEFLLKEYMVQSAGELASDYSMNEPGTLTKLADDIDEFEKKLTVGMLVVGGLATIVNPVVGLLIAAKAILPGPYKLINKYGVRALGEKLDSFRQARNIRKAEENVTKQFEGVDSLRVVNPILQELDLALRTTEDEHDPLIDPNLASGSIPELTNERWRQLTEAAICHVYEDIFNDSSRYEEACLGPEDIRWLRTMYATYDKKTAAN